MRLSFILRLAIRNVVGHKLRSVLTIAGISIGICFIVFLISLGYGLERVSTKEVANLEALQIIDVTPGKSKIVKINDQTLSKFRGLANVTNVEPQLSVVGTASYGGSTVEGVVYGKNVEFLKLEDMEFAAGSPYQSNSANNVIINRAIAKALGINDLNAILGKSFDIKTNVSSEYFGASSDPVVTEQKFKVVGVLNTEDSPYVYIPLDYFKHLDVSYYNSVKIKVNDKTNTDTVKQQVENLGYKATTLKDTVDQINQFFNIFKLILLAFGAIAVLIAVLGMFNTLTISLLEKTREISFMKVLGTTSKDIWRLFVLEAILIGTIGGVTGIGVGLGISAVLNRLISDLATKTGNKPVEIFYAPSLIIVLIFAVAILISFLTGVYPSRRAAKIDPLEVMRYE